MQKIPVVALGRAQLDNATCAVGPLAVEPAFSPPSLPLWGAHTDGAASFLGSHGKLLWNGNWVTFLDTMLHVTVLGYPGRNLRLPTRIRSVCVDPVLHLKQVQTYKDDKQGNSLSHGQDSPGFFFVKFQMLKSGYIFLT